MDFSNLFHPELFPEIGIKVLAAIICGGLIGFEREIKSKPAGLKTNLLICVGACLYTVIGILLVERSGGSGPADPGRIPAQIVSGIGFLGAGTIIQARGAVVGLTSAATIWVVAAIGMCIGMGYLVPAILFSATVLFTLSGITVVEKRLIVKKFSYEITCDQSVPTAKQSIYQALENHDLDISRFDVSEEGGHTMINVIYFNTKRRHKAIFNELLALPGVGKIRRK